jgi:CheY-like chemotaxis protein/HPt (histidine-containing phosphotransfer) domain-containing protein
LQEAHTAGEEYHGVVIIDYDKSHTESIHIAKVIRDKYEYQDISLIAVCSLQEQNSKQELAEAGFNAQLTKPISLEGLKHTLSDALNHNIGNLIEKPAKNIHKIVQSKLDGSNLAVLLVEDNEINRRVAQGIFAQYNISPDIAVNGREAVEKTAAKKYDIIFMDCAMPILDGYAATKEIRARGDKQPIVAMTANAMSDDREKCLRAGMDNYISKPINPELIFGALKSYCKPLETQEPSAELRILIAEDDSSMLNTLTMAIHAAFPHANIKETSDGIEACTLLGSFMPNVLLTDIVMPNADGAAIIRHIRKEKRYQNTHIIVITGLDEKSEEVLNIRSLGVDTIIFKPFSLRSITHTIADIIKKPSQSLTKTDDSFSIFEPEKLELIFPGDTPSQIEVLKATLETFPLLIATCRDAFSSDTMDEVYRNAHSIKGASLNIGALRLAEAAKNAEYAARDNKKIEIETLLNKIDEELHLLEKEPMVANITKESP